MRGVLGGGFWGRVQVGVEGGGEGGVGGGVGWGQAKERQVNLHAFGKTTLCSFFPVKTRHQGTGPYGPML